MTDGSTTMINRPGAGFSCVVSVTEFFGFMERD